MASLSTGLISKAFTDEAGSLNYGQDDKKRWPERFVFELQIANSKRRKQRKPSSRATVIAQLIIRTKDLPPKAHLKKGAK
jgi:hypothetical protein